MCGRASWHLTGIRSRSLLLQLDIGLEMDGVVGMMMKRWVDGVMEGVMDEEMVEWSYGLKGENCENNLRRSSPRPACRCHVPVGFPCFVY